MLNGVWPSVHWNLYDWYYAPGGGFFGAKKANEAVHIAYDYFSGRVVAYNSTLIAQTGMTATATLYTIPGLEQSYTTQVGDLTVPADAATNVLTIPAGTGPSPTYFIRLELRDATGAVVSTNLYWYSTSPDRLGNSHTWWKTAIHRYADLTGLNGLGENRRVTAAVTRTVAAGEQTATITLTNASATNIAFFLRPEITAGKGGTEVLPIDYSDNYVSLFPGESTTITARYATADLGGKAPYLLLRGYNVPTKSTAVP
jgi:exo-1,4-beta-D-glucosaminidase